MDKSQLVPRFTKKQDGTDRQIAGNQVSIPPDSARPDKSSRESKKTDSKALVRQFAGAVVSWIQF